MKVNTQYKNIVIENLVFEFCDSKENFNIASKLIAQYYISDSIWKNRITKRLKKILNLDTKTTMLRELKCLLNESLETDFETKAVSAFPYPGGKHKMRRELNYILEQLYNDKVDLGETFDTYADIFFGAGGSLISMSDKLSQIGIKKVIANELNKTIVNVHKLIKEEPEALIDAFIDLVREKIVCRYGCFFPELEQYKELTKELAQELDVLEKKNDRGIQTAVRFLILQNLQYSGNYNPSEVFEQSNYKGDVYDLKKIVEITMSFPNRIKKISSIYNKFEIEFTNIDAWDLLQKHKHNRNVLFNIDLIYVKEDTTAVDNFTQKELDSLTSDQIELVKSNYGIKSFPTVEYLKEMKNINLIYNNNAHYVIEHYRRKFGLNKIDFVRIETSPSAKKGTKRSTVTEYIVYGLNSNNSNKN